MPYRLYIDEVGNADLKSSTDPNHRYLSLTGVMIDYKHIVDVIRPEMELMKIDCLEKDHDDHITLHRRDILERNPPFDILLDPEKARKFDDQLIKCLASWNYTIITVIIDKEEHKNKYKVWRHDPYHYCLQILIERYKLFLEMRSERGDVMIEQRGKKSDKRLKKSFHSIMTQGLPHYPIEVLRKFITSREIKMKSKAENIEGLQIADLIAYPNRQYVLKRLLGHEIHNTFSDHIMRAVDDKFLSYKGKIEGYGIKKLP